MGCWRVTILFLSQKENLICVLWLGALCSWGTYMPSSQSRSFVLIVLLQDFTTHWFTTTWMLRKTSNSWTDAPYSVFETAVSSPDSSHRRSSHLQRGSSTWNLDHPAADWLRMCVWCPWRNVHQSVVTKTCHAVDSVLLHGLLTHDCYCLHFMHRCNIAMIRPCTSQTVPQSSE